MFGFCFDIKNFFTLALDSFLKIFKNFISYEDIILFSARKI